MNKGERVPIFYLGKIESPTSMGLALMYRLTYKSSVQEAIKHTSKNHFCEKPDFAETLFGFTKDKTGLKGRVSISPAVGIDAKQAKEVVSAVLGAPKPTYYPNYIKQSDPRAGYSTFMDPDCEVRGWKRYPARGKEALIDPPKPPNATEKVKTCLIPLQSGARFEFSIKVHNLRPTELGALIWAVTWGDRDKFVHSLGMGKAFGYGQVKLSVVAAELKNVKGMNLSLSDLKEHMNIFSEFMDGQMQKPKTTELKKPVQAGGFAKLAELRASMDTTSDDKPDSPWLASEQLRQLLAMADPNCLSIDAQKQKLRHMTLAPDKHINEFADAKAAELSLKAHI